MNKKILKILTGLSAIAFAGLMSFVPATNVQAGTIGNGAVLNIDLPEENISYYENSNDYSVSTDLSYLNMNIQYANTDYIECNIWLNTQSNTEENFTLALSIPYEINSFAFSRFYYVDYENGPIYSYSANGNTITVDACTCSDGYFDAIWHITLGGLYNPSVTTNLLYEDINNTANDIIKAAAGMNHDGSENPQKVVFYNYNGAINYRIINALAKTQGVTLLYTFEYQGYVFTSAITSENAANIILENEDWYGSCYIAQNCPTALVGVAQ